MATATRKHNPAWQAELAWGHRYVPTTEDAPEGETEDAPGGETAVRFLKVRECFVDVSRPGGAPIRFRVHHRGGCSLTVTDPRRSGVAGLTGIWGTLPAPPAPRPRSLTLAGFQTELAGFVGPERADAIVRTIRSFF